MKKLMLAVCALALMFMAVPAFAGDGGERGAPGGMVFASAAVDMPGCYLEGDGEVACVALFNVKAFEADIERALEDASREMDRRYPNLAERFSLSDEEMRAITPTSMLMLIDKGPKPKRPKPGYLRPPGDCPSGLAA